MLRIVRVDREIRLDSGDRSRADIDRAIDANMESAVRLLFLAHQEAGKNMPTRAALTIDGIAADSKLVRLQRRNRGRTGPNYDGRHLLARVELLDDLVNAQILEVLDHGSHGRREPRNTQAPPTL